MGWSQKNLKVANFLSIVIFDDLNFFAGDDEESWLRFLTPPFLEQIADFGSKMISGPNWTPWSLMSKPGRLFTANT